MKEEPDFYAPFEPEVIVNYPQDGMDDDDDQVSEDGRVTHVTYGFVEWPLLHLTFIYFLNVFFKWHFDGTLPPFDL